MAAVAAGLWLVYGLGFVGYDSVYALIWGRQLSHGQLPDFFEVTGSPTPHPLLNAVTAVLAPLGDRALPALALLSLVAFAALGWGAFRLGHVLFSVPTGIAFAVILLTRDLLVAGVYQALEEIPFLALVIWSIVLEAQQRRRGAPVLVLLGLAGLLRPEAWLLSAAYLVYLLPPLASRQRVRLVALAAAAPLLWALSDLAITGDPLHSLHHTQKGAARLERPRELRRRAGVRAALPALHPPHAGGLGRARGLRRRALAAVRALGPPGRGARRRDARVPRPRARRRPAADPVLLRPGQHARALLRRRRVRMAALRARNAGPARVDRRGARARGGVRVVAPTRAGAARNGAFGLDHPPRSGSLAA